MLVAASSCGKAQVVIHEARIDFEFPADGSTVTAGDDVSDSQTGVQVDVRARVSGLADGDKLVLTNSRDLVGGVPRQTEGTVRDGEVIFPGYSLAAGDIVLRLALPGVAL